MTLGDMQSVLQLAVALNAIYLSLKDISSPSIRREREALALLKSDILARKQKNTEADVIGEFNNVSISYNEIIVEFEVIDLRVRLGALVVSIIYTILLISSAVFFETVVPVWVALIVSTIGYVPIIWGVWINIAVALRLENALRPRRQAIELALISDIAA